jgi:colanic acid biosynthesis glycosyl transferase WcaI
MNSERGGERCKIVFVNRYFDPDQSASSQMLTDLARGLAGRGLIVHVVCSRQLYTDAVHRLPSSETRSGVDVHRVATTRFGRARLLGRSIDYGSFYFSAGAALLRLLRSGDVVIVMTDPPLMSVLTAIVAFFKGAALVNWQQDVYPEIATLLGANPLPRWLDALTRKMRDNSLRRARINVVICARMLEYFAKHGIPPGKLRVIENWADDKLIKPKPPGSSLLRTRLGLSNRFVVGYSGNLGRAHEFDTLLAAADELRQDLSVVFLMVGGGALMEPLRRTATERGLENLLFLPYQAREDLEDSLAAADVHLISLRPALEGLIMPSKAYGILAAGRPAIFIGDSDGDVARMIGGGRCGLAVNVNAGRELVAAIRRLQSEPLVRAEMGERARELFLSRYTLANAVEQWHAALDFRPPPRVGAAEPPGPSSR